MPSKYIAGMRSRAKRRKSKWNLLLIPFSIASIAFGWYGLVEPLLRFRSRFFPIDAFLMNGTRLGNIAHFTSPLFYLPFASVYWLPISLSG